MKGGMIRSDNTLLFVENRTGFTGYKTMSVSASFMIDIVR
jgi:hypothetical protein